MISQTSTGGKKNQISNILRYYNLLGNFSVSNILT